MNELRETAFQIRISILQMLHEAGSGHLGGSLDLADIFTWLYFKEIKHRPEQPEWEGRDRVILSIGHVAPVLYATLAQSGYFPKEELLTLRKMGSRLQGHPSRDFGLPGVELAAGSLGQGVAVAVGMALAAKQNRTSNRIFAVVGDGELQEGSVWEAMMAASHYHLDNLIIIVDRNRVQIDGETEHVMSLEPIAEKFHAFGCAIESCNGNDFQSISEAFAKIKSIKNQPIVILANTQMGYGVPEIEGNNKWHGKVPNDEELKRFLKTLRK